MVTPQQLQRASMETGCPVGSLENVWMLVRFLDLFATHPFLKTRAALKGGTALNLFVFDLARLSVDVDLNYIGAADRETMMADRPKLDAALAQVASRLGCAVRRAPTEHAGGKWRLSYASVLGRSAIIEIDVNFIFRVPLWTPVGHDSREFLGARAKHVSLLDVNELAAGKLAALLSRGASRDLFDARELLASDVLNPEKLRLAFVVYGGINRADWRTVSTDGVITTVEDVRTQLLPMLRQDIRPDPGNLQRWTSDLIDETRALLAAVLPLADREICFLDGLNDEGEIDASLLAADRALQERIQSHPGLQWKARNVKRRMTSPPRNAAT